MRTSSLRMAAGSALVVLVATLAGSPVSATAHFTVIAAGGGNGYEPGVDRLANGTLFVNSPQGGGSAQSGLWRKAPGDAAFSKVTFPAPYNRYPGGFDNDVAIKGNRIYMLDLWVGSNAVIRSDDGGLTWTAGTPLSTVPSDREWIEVGKTDVNGEDTVFALSALIAPPSTAFLAISRDSGDTWTEHTPVPLPTPKAGFSGQLLADDTGFVGFPYIEGGRMKFAGSPDEGKTWTVRNVSYFSDSFGGHIQGAAMVGNTIHVVYTSSVGYGVRVKYARSTDKGLTWFGNDVVPEFNGGALPIDLGSAGSSMFPWVAASGSKVAATWYQAYTSTSGPLLSTPTDPNVVSAGAKWRLMYTESLDSGNTWTVPVPVEAAAAQSGPICTNGIACTGGRQLGDFQQVLIDGNGKSVIIYARGGTARLATQN